MTTAVTYSIGFTKYPGLLLLLLLLGCTLYHTQGMPPKYNVYMALRDSTRGQLDHARTAFCTLFRTNTGSDGYWSLRSPGDGGHVTRFGRQVTASPIPSQVKRSVSLSLTVTCRHVTGLPVSRHVT